MEKNLLKAIVISIVILLGWQFLMTWLYPPKPKPEGEQQTAAAPAQPQQPAPAETPAPAPPPQQQASEPVTAPAEAVPERTITVQTSRWVAKFSNRGAAPTSWVLAQGPHGHLMLAADGTPLELIPDVGLKNVGPPLRVAIPGDDAATARLSQATYSVTAHSADGAELPLDGAINVPDGQRVELAFSVPDPATNQVVTKRYTFTGGQFDFQLVVDSSAGAKPFQVFAGPRIGDQSIKTEGTYTHSPPYVVVTNAAGKSSLVHGGDVTDGGQKVMDGIPRWVAVTDNYFAMAIAGADPGQVQAVVTNSKLKYDESEAKPHDFLSVAMPVQSGQPVHVFVGPKDPELLESVSKDATNDIGQPVDFGTIINYGWFWWLVKPIIPVIDTALQWTNKVTGNYGWSIIIVTIIFNLLFFPLRYKSSVAMKRAAKLQPRMKEIQEKLKKYKPTDPQYKEIQQEQMALMREGNPLGGCLPMLVQFPFFWAFFIYFTTTFVVRQQPWILWVKDLTAPDPYYILPVIMCIAQIGSTMITPMPQSDDPGMKMQRRLMTWVMPIVITYFFLIAAPSGLVLYWMTLNIVGIGMQFAINKMMPPDVQQTAEPAGSKKKGSKKGPSTELVGSEK